MSCCWEEEDISLEDSLDQEQNCISRKRARIIVFKFRKLEHESKLFAYIAVTSPHA